jgi:hypothetical protein
MRLVKPPLPRHRPPGDARRLAGRIAAGATPGLRIIPKRLPSRGKSDPSAGGFHARRKRLPCAAARRLPIFLSQ